MRLVVGLGNPGPEYAGTRHNIGFEVCDHLSRMGRFDPERLFKNALVQRGTLANNEILLVKPQTFMNLSGDAVGAILRFYKALPEELIVVHDELDFAPGVVKLKPGGGHGGHNGLRSIASHVSADFIRIRIGIGKPPSAARGADHVLSRFDAASRVLMNEAIVTAADAVVTVLTEGLQRAMNRVNQTRPTPP